jgi:hypothetical protein
MWTVISQRRKARQGLAVILLAVILIGCLLFARAVQQYKYRQYKLTMDRAVKFSTPAGEFSMTVSSKWPPLPPESLNSSMIQGWSVPLPMIKSSAYFYLDLLGRQPEQKADFLQVINRYIPLEAVYPPSLQIEKIQEGTLSLANLDVSLNFKSGRAVQFLLLRLIFLPDGTSLALVLVGPQAGEQTLAFWIEEMARTLKFSPSGETPKVPPGNEEQKVKNWTYHVKERLNVGSV